MPSLPAKLNHGDSLKRLVPTINAIIEFVRAITPRPSATIGVSTTSSGTVLSARIPEKTAALLPAAAGRAVWNGKVYDIYGMLQRDFTANTEENRNANTVDQDGNWIIGGEYVCMTPSVNQNGGVSWAFSMVDGESINPFDYGKIRFKVANRHQETVDGQVQTTYTLSDDQAGAIRIPFPTGDVKKYQILSIASNGKLLFDYARAHELPSS
jgi:hypothetical protein